MSPGLALVDVPDALRVDAEVESDQARAHALIKDELNIVLEIVKPPRDAHTFNVLPFRWIVERTFGWWNRERRLSKDYERFPNTTEAIVRVAMIRLMTRRLSPDAAKPIPLLPPGDPVRSPFLLPAGDPVRPALLLPAGLDSNSATNSS